MTNDSPSLSRAGRPRNPAVQRVVIDAVLAMVSDGATLSSLSLVSISLRAGVSRNSIYRRWNSKERLFVDVVKSIERVVPDRTEHSARENLAMMLEFSFASASDERVFRLEQTINAEALTFPDLFEYYRDTVLTPVSTALKMAIRAGKETGEIRFDVDESVLVAVLVACKRAHVSGGDVWDIDVGLGPHRLVDLVFDGVAPT
jgi:AcrR family transcriptional regulator